MRDKRQFKRFKNHLKMKFEVLVSPSWEETGENYLGESWLEDISHGGILFNYQASLPIGSFLEVEIEVPGREFPINLTGRVVRIEEIVPKKKYELGLVFKNIFEKDRELLETHLYNQETRELSHA